MLGESLTSVTHAGPTLPGEQRLLPPDSALWFLPPQLMPGTSEGQIPRGPHFVYQGCHTASCGVRGEVPTEGEGQLAGLGFLQSSPKEQCRWAFLSVKWGP